MKYFIGLDIGTSSVKAMLLNEREIVKIASRDYPVFYPKNGWSEQDPEDWYRETLSAMKELLSGIDGKSVVSLSFSGQMHGLVMLDEEDRVIRPAILWNDGRSTKEVAYLNETVGKGFLLDHTGNIAFAGFTAPKLLWVKANEPEHFKRARKILLPKDYVAYRLSGTFATDVSDAAGTLYFDTEHRCWSAPMLELLGITEEQLPKVYESNEIIGSLRPELAKELGLSDVKVVIGGGDNAASAIGTGTLEDGACNLSLGTSGTVFVVSDHYRCDRVNALHTFCSANGKYHYLACILSAASCQKWWMEEILKANYDFENAEGYLGKSRVLFLPYLMGERSPINDPDVRGAFFGLSMDTCRAEMSLAVLEGVAFALRQNVDAIRSLGVTITSSKVCGGGTKTRLWLKILASVLNIRLQLPVMEHGGGLGAALLAAEAVLPPKEYSAMETRFYAVKETVEPDEALVPLYEEKYQKYLQLYPAIRGLNL